MMADYREMGHGLAFSGPDAPDEDELYRCVHCGFCLQACPTYIETGLETESPRGRIALMKAVNEGRIGITPGVVRHWDLCIQCRACEVACPSGVNYGRLIESTMSQVERGRQKGMLAKAVPAVMESRRRLRLVVGALRVYQRSGLQSLLRKSRALRLLPGDLAELESSLPAIRGASFEAKGQVIPAVGRRRATIALLSGCVMPMVNGPQMSAAARVLARNGCDVAVPRGQVCCGAISSHVGDLDSARKLARRNIDVFLDAGVDAVVVASAGCGTRMKEYGHLLRRDRDYSAKAERFGGLVKDIHEFLVDLPFEPPVARLDYRVTYQDSCHLANAQRVTEQPRRILRSIPGVEFVELPNASKCCGAGGTYTITERESSLRVLATKMAAVRETGADVVATANPGCVMQLQYGARREGLAARTVYVTDLLDEAYALEDAQGASVG